MLVRRMEKADVYQVAQNEAACFSMPWSEQAFLDTLIRPQAAYYVAELDGKIVGHCGVTDIVGEGEITNVAVLTEYRGCGIAGAMLERLLLEGKEAGMTAFTLEVRAGNVPAIRLYEKSGFVTEGIRRGFYDNPKEDALIMWKR